MKKLSKEVQSKVTAILRKFLDPGTEVYVFGSRMLGTATKRSDLDILIKKTEEIPLAQMALIKSAFEESDITFTVDVLDYHAIAEGFRGQIMEHAQKLEL